MLNKEEVRFNQIRKEAFSIIMTFPKSKNGQPYLVMKNKRKLFFNKFIKKYGLNKSQTTYKKSDLIRRYRLVEFFKFFIQKCELKPARMKNGFLFDSHFHRMVIINSRTGISSKLELLSFYPYIKKIPPV
jgi:hypothetical protein